MATLQGKSSGNIVTRCCKSWRSSFSSTLWEISCRSCVSSASNRRTAHAVLASACEGKLPSRINGHAQAATAGSSGSHLCRAFAQAQAIFARSNELNSTSFGIDCCSTASNSSGASMQAVAKAWTMLSRSRGVKVATVCTAACAIAANISGATMPKDENVEAIMARPCGSNSWILPITSDAIASNSLSCSNRNVEKAHTKLVRF
mmetsp:Transcript_78732/g.182650  ORF Transcript_78732/g.182650 Transcript_78732/m.182650 type:complete len:204 (-) Transcript_78732:172-783(-)